MRLDPNVEVTLEEEEAMGYQKDEPDLPPPPTGERGEMKVTICISDGQGDREGVEKELEVQGSDTILGLKDRLAEIADGPAVSKEKQMYIHAGRILPEDSSLEA